MPTVIWGQAGDGADPATFPVLVNPHVQGTNALALPGVAGNYASLPDVNLLDADTAHGAQGVGNWQNAGGSPTISTRADSESAFGPNMIEVTSTANGNVNVRANNQGVNAIPVTGGETYAFTTSVKAFDTSRQCKLRVRELDGAGALVATSIDASLQSAPTSGVVSFSESVTLDPSTAFVDVLVDILSTTSGESFGISATCVREGSDATFLPSTRIKGNVDLRAHLAPQEWASGIPTLIAKRTTGDGLAYQLVLNASGQLAWSVRTGSTDYFNDGISSVVPGTTDGQALWVRVTRTTAGAITYYTSTDRSSWTSFDTDTGQSGAIDVNGAPVEFGSNRGGTSNMLHGALYAAEVRDGIDGPVVASLSVDNLEAGNDNLLDADTSFLASGVGDWTANFQCTVAQEDAEGATAVFGTKVLRVSSTASSGSSLTRVALSGLTAATTYTMIGYARLQAGTDPTVRFNARTAAGDTLGDAVATSGGSFTKFFVTFTTGGAETSLNVDISFGAATGRVLDFQAFCLREGSTTTFVAPNGSGVTDEGHTVATFRTGDATAECVDRPCWQFTGSEYLTITDRDALDFGTGDFTVAAGFATRITTPANPAPLIGKRNDADPYKGFEFGTDTNDWPFVAVDDGPTAQTINDSTLSANDGADHVLISGRDGTNLFLLLDDNPTKTTSDSGLDIDTAGPLYVGASILSLSRFFSGLISWVAVWDRALTAAERADVAAWDGSPGSKTPPAIYSSTLYLNAADVPTQTALADGDGLNNSLSSILYPNMGKAAMRARKLALGGNWGSRLWDVDYDHVATAPVTQPPNVGAAYEWWADNIEETDGSALATWHGRTGELDLTQGTGAAQPIYRASVAALGGRAAVEFDGTDDFMQAAFSTLSQPNTIVVVAQFDDPGTTQRIMVDGNGVNAEREAVYSTGGNWHLFAGAVLNSGDADDAQGHLLVATFDSTSTLDLDGVEIASGSAGSNPLGGVVVGSDYQGASSFWDGHIAYVAIIDGTLTAARKTAIEQWASNHYGLGF